VKEREPDWDPRPDERVWYSHTRTGDRGFLVRRDGKDMIRLDRPGDDQAVRKLNSEWQTDHDYRPLTRHHVGQVTFEADKRLCWPLGLHSLGNREWLSLSDKERIAWMNQGPPDGVRLAVWKAIVEALREISQ